MDVLAIGGNELAPVWAVLSLILKSGRVAWRGALESWDTSLEYQATGESFNAILAKLTAGTFCSVQFRQDEPIPILCGMYAPRFSGSPLTDWTCVVEAPPVALSSLFEHAKLEGGIQFVSWTIDEQPDLETENVTVASFPWQDWRLVRAAVRKEDGCWEERSGPSA